MFWVRLNLVIKKVCIFLAYFLFGVNYFGSGSFSLDSKKFVATAYIKST
ncbi:7125_t:CDS:1, partial [Gigaspora rosea]